MTTLVVFSGLQAAGKSTFFREHFAATHELVSKDAWPNAANREKRQRRIIRELLTAQRSVVVDNTNPTAQERVPLVEIATELGVPAMSYAFEISYADAIQRNATRIGKQQVPEAGIRTVAGKLTLPQAEEGFAEYFIVRTIGGVFEVTKRDLERAGQQRRERQESW